MSQEGTEPTPLPSHEEEPSTSHKLVCQSNLLLQSATPKSPSNSSYHTTDISLYFKHTVSVIGLIVGMSIK
eukprot:3287491-Ditylum_brightwellii.AAC.1